MRYRALTPEGDYQFGRAGIFLINTPAAVAQAVSTRLGLETGEWFLDSQEGTPYADSILGRHTQATRDIVVKARIVDTPGVTGIVGYSSAVSADRKFNVAATVDTQYGGAATVTITTQS